MKIIDNLFSSLYLFFEAIDDGRPDTREVCLLASNKITHDSEYKSFKPAAYRGIAQAVRCLNTSRIKLQE